MTENHGEKQRKSIGKYGKQLVESNPFIKKDDYNTERDSTTILKQKKIFNKLIRQKEISESSENINYGDLTYHFKGKIFMKKFLMM